MSDTPLYSETSDDDPYTAILNEYHRALKALGTDPAPEEVKLRRDQLIEQHPLYAERLRNFFEGQDLLPSPLKVPGYDVLEELGRGGMGVVYKARALTLNRFVALKLMVGIAAGQPDRLQRFKLEAESIARLQHANIVQVYAYGEQQGQLWLAMEFVQGGNLAVDLKSTPQPASRAARFVELLAEAMHHAHERGIVHRDLKPLNVLLTPDGLPKITDFGLAKKLDAVDGQTQAGAILGTPSYMAPEQAAGKGHEAGPPADVYALGAILYEMLTGRPPFRGATELETLNQVCNLDPVPPRSLQPGCPRDLEIICLKCLQKEPARRYHTAQALADDLHRSLAGDPIEAKPVGLVEWTLKKVKRHKARVVAATVLLLSLAIVTVVLLRGASDREKDRIDTKDQIAGALEESNQHKGLAQASNNPEEYALALRAAKRAAGLLDRAAAGDDLRQRVGSLVAELEAAYLAAQTAKEAQDRDDRLLKRFHSARLRKTYPRGDSFDYEGARKLYLAAFLADGVNLDRASREEIVAGFAGRSLPVRIEAAASLTDLGMLNAVRPASNLLELIGNIYRRPPSWQRFFEAADAIDDHPGRRSLRRPMTQPSSTITRELAQVSREVNIKEHSLTSLTFLADALGGFGLYDDAVALLHRLHELYQNDFWVNHLLSIYCGHTRTPRWDDAARFSTAAMACNRNSPLPDYNLGVALVALGRHEEAINRFRRATEIDRAFSAAWLNLGSVLGTSGKADEAIRAWVTAYKLDRNSYHVMANIGSRFFIVGDFERAEPIYRLCTQISPNDALAHYNLGTACLRLERFDESLPYFRQALKISPAMLPARINLAAALQNLGQYAEALQEYTAAHDQAKKSDDAVAARIEQRDIPLCRKECKLAAMLPALREGKVKLETPDDFHVAALVAFRHGEFATSASCFFDNLQTAADRKWLEDHSYTAACAAARAGRVEKQEARAALRRHQAQEWLRHDLSIWEKHVSSGKAPERIWGARMLRRSLADVHLAGVRDMDKLDRLPEDERAEWKQLWATVRKLTSQ